MNILYETNGVGFLGWIVELSGAYVRGRTIEEARSKIEKEIADYGNWLGIKVQKTGPYVETIKKCGLHVEDADTSVIFDTELVDFKNLNDFDYWCNLVLVSGLKAEGTYKLCRHKHSVDIKMVRKTFYGDVYSTIQGQFEHIVDVQNYYLGQINAHIDLEQELQTSRNKFVDQLKIKYLSEGNKLYHYVEEDWTIKKIVRRIIWHDRIHTKAMERMEKRLNGTDRTTSFI